MTSHFLSRLRDRVLSFLLVLCACCTLNALFSLEAAAALRPEQLAIVINDAEPNSVAVGEYYRKRRNIPKANVVHVSIAGKPQRISLERFRLLKGHAVGLRHLEHDKEERRRSERCVHGVRQRKRGCRHDRKTQRDGEVGNPLRCRGQPKGACADA